MPQPGWDPIRDRPDATETRQRTIVVACEATSGAGATCNEVVQMPVCSPCDPKKYLPSLSAIADTMSSGRDKRKRIRCVPMLSVNRCFRIAQRLGWIPLLSTSGDLKSITIPSSFTRLPENQKQHSPNVFFQFRNILPSSTNLASTIRVDQRRMRFGNTIEQRENAPA